jgi:glucokinase
MRRNSLQTSDLESNILKLVRSVDSISRVELARSLGLSPSTAGIYVGRLIAKGFLMETEKATREAGRPPMQLKLNPEGGEFIGVDFEASNVLAAAVDFSDTPLRNARAQIDTTDTPETIIRKIEQIIAKVFPAKGRRPLAIGIGVPGLVNSGEGIAVHYKYIASWENVPLARRIAKKYGLPVYLENNVRSMALAELWFGQGLGLTDFLCVGVRSGLGAGMVLDGRLYCGAFHDAGEFGRWRCPMPSKRATPWFDIRASDAEHGPELQDVASVRAIQRALKNAISAGEKTILHDRPAPLSLEDILQALQQRDPLAMFVIDEVARSLGWGIAQLSLVIDPQKIILAGPLTMLGDAILVPVRARIKSLLDLSGSRMPEVVGSAMGEFSGALGAAALALHEWQPEVVLGKTQRKNASADKVRKNAGSPRRLPVKSGRRAGGR